MDYNAESPLPLEETLNTREIITALDKLLQLTQEEAQSSNSDPNDAMLNRNIGTAPIAVRSRAVRTLLAEGHHPASRLAYIEPEPNPGVSPRVKVNVIHDVDPVGALGISSEPLIHALSKWMPRVGGNLATIDLQILPLRGEYSGETPIGEGKRTVITPQTSDIEALQMVREAFQAPESGITDSLDAMLLIGTRAYTDTLKDQMAELFGTDPAAITVLDFNFYQKGILTLASAQSIDPVVKRETHRVASVEESRAGVDTIVL